MLSREITPGKPARVSRVCARCGKRSGRVGLQGGADETTEKYALMHVCEGWGTYLEGRMQRDACPDCRKRA